MKEIKAKHYTDTVIYSVDKILRNVKAALRQRIDTLNIGITSEQFVVLDTIGCYEQIYQQKLSEIMMKDKSNTKRILQVLEEKKLITKEAGSINNRLVYFIKITPEGEKIISDTMPKIKKFITEIFLNISDEEIDTLHILSDKFQKDLSHLKIIDNN